MKLHIKIVPILFVLFFLGCAHYPGNAQKTPREIVELFMEVFGTSEIADVAPYLTANFRNGKPGPLWAIDFWGALKNVKYKRISGKIVKEYREKDRAFIEVATTIFADKTEANQKELYILIKDRRKGWLIDELKVGDEIQEEKMQKT